MAHPLAAEGAPGAVDLLSVWSGESVRVGEVLAAIEELRRPEAMPPTRASVLTLVIVARERDEAARAQAAVHELGGRHPARVLTLLSDDDQGPGASQLDAEVRLLGGESEGHEVWFEEIDLQVRGPVTAHLDSLIEPFTLPDLPVVCWFVGQLPDVDDPLLAAADVLLVDARQFGEVACFATLAKLARKRPVVDLSWARLTPWRSLLAGLLEGPDFRPFVTCVVRAEVWGRKGPCHLLAGWLADRLALGRTAVELSAAPHVGLRLHARSSRGQSATFEVIRGDDRLVAAKAAVAGGPASEAVLQLPEATPAWGLPEALSRLEHDRVYERALQRAVEL
ncbi:MAG: glucose-6-phosphate dehydrogenase assembly protein OpcA [Actinobacteria bacterium]|nr:glucose-6-phosphate dehydrogenase assembly protein OpcA [Actinomycetota bacterium]